MGNDADNAGKLADSTISIHVPSWGTTTYKLIDMYKDIKFQSTFPRGERPTIRRPVSSFVQFQSTFPRGERQSCACKFPIFSNFNPRSLVGNDEEIRNHLGGKHYISIHVPSWGTTIAICDDDNLRIISIHVPSWGTTEHDKRDYESLQNFNPRSLVGNDSLLWQTLKKQDYFNPRSLVGNDGKFSQIFFVFLCNKYNFSTFYYPFSLFFSVIHVTFLIFVVRILPAFYVYF